MESLVRSPTRIIQEWESIDRYESEANRARIFEPPKPWTYDSTGMYSSHSNSNSLTIGINEN